MSTVKTDILKSVEKALQGWGKRLEAIRGDVERNKWAQNFGMNKNTWGEYEHEKTAPKLTTLIELRTRHGVDLNWLATGEMTDRGQIDMAILVAALESVAQDLTEYDHETRAKVVAALYRDRMRIKQKQDEDLANQGRIKTGS